MSAAPCISVSVSILCFTVSVLGKSVVQTPPDLLKKPDEFAEIQCSHSIPSYNVIQWYKQNQSITNLQLMGYRNIEQDTIEKDFNGKIKMNGDGRNNVTLTITDLTVTDSAVYFCAAYYNNLSPAHFGNGTKLTVLDPYISKSEPIVKILNATKKESCKKKITLVCLANNFYPDHVKVAWFVGQQEITEDVATDPHATIAPSGGLYTISSRLKVSQKMWKKPTNKFTCKVSYYNGSFTSEHSDFVYGVAGGYDRDSYVKSSQWMKLAYGVTIAKSGLYGLVIFVFVWRKGSNGK